MRPDAEKVEYPGEPHASEGQASMTSSPHAPQASSPAGATSPGAAWRSAAAAQWRRLTSRDALLLLAIFLTGLMLVAPDLMIGFASINPYDEAKYIDSGRSLLAGDLRQLSWGPLVALLYAPFVLLRPVHPDWFLLSAWGGRFVLYTLIWWSTLHLARRLRSEASPLIVSGVIFLALYYLPLLENSSDAAFSVCSALALACLLDVRASHRLSPVLLGSVLCGLGMLARAEAVLFLAVYVVMCLAVTMRSASRIRILAASALPAVIVLGGYFAVSWVSMGRIELGMGSKSYDSFEVNQPLASGTDREASRAETRRLFGTPDENQHSVLRAVLRNPPAFLQRVAARVLDLPRQFLDMNGKRLGGMLALLAAWGGVAFLRARKARTLALLAIWAAPSAVALAFLPRHFLLQTSFLVVVLAAAGAGYIADPGQPLARRWAVLASALALLVFGGLGGLGAILAAGVLTTAALLLAWAASRPVGPQNASAVALLILFAAGLVLRGEYPFPDFPRPGVTAEERAVHAMQESFAPGSRIATAVPLPALAAGMTPVDMDGPRDAAGFRTWLASENIDGVYVGPGASDTPLRSTVTSLIGSGLAVELREGDVLLTRTLPPTSP
jgi:hypothetical protein